MCTSMYIYSLVRKSKSLWREINYLLNITLHQIIGNAESFRAIKYCTRSKIIYLMLHITVIFGNMFWNISFWDWFNVNYMTVIDIPMGRNNVYELPNKFAYNKPSSLNLGLLRYELISLYISIMSFINMLGIVNLFSQWNIFRNWQI